MGIKADLKVLSVPPTTLTYDEIQKQPGFYRTEGATSVIYVNDKQQAFYLNTNILEVANTKVWSTKTFVKVRAEFTIKSED